jgi:tRNA pseudouridine55 synthase
MDTAAFAEGFVQGKVLLFNKPLYWTSFDLVSKVRNILKNRLHLKKLKVGHAGTLDPLATGLLIICTGKETRNIEKYQAEPKEYKATVTLGATTPSFDRETDVDNLFPVDHITRSGIERVLESFVGIQLQEPPIFRPVSSTEHGPINWQGKVKRLLSQPGKLTFNSLNSSPITLP